jgi:phosphomevalonate kinase
MLNIENKQKRSNLSEELSNIMLENINADMQSMIDSLELLPKHLSEKIDPVIQENINKIVDSASATQEYVKELQAENKSIIKKELNNAQTDFISSAKDSLERLIKPHSDKLAEIPNSIDNLSSELECISKKIETIGKPKSNSFVIIIVMILSLIVGGIGGVFFADNYNSKALKAKDLEYSVLATSIDATLAELPKAQKNKVFGILKKHITAETSKQSK